MGMPKLFLDSETICVRRSKEEARASLLVASQEKSKLRHGFTQIFYLLNCPTRPTKQ
jgi:hypothetical protein